MGPGLQRAITRRLRAMWPVSKVVADLEGEAPVADLVQAIARLLVGEREESI